MELDISSALSISKWSNCIYINSNPGYNLAELGISMNESILKIGSSKCLPARYYSYKTYSPIATQILHYYYIHDYDCYELDDDIKRDLDKYRIHSSGGIEFYNSRILEHLEYYFQSKGITFTRYEDMSNFPSINNSNRIPTIKEYQDEDLSKASRKPKYNITLKSKPQQTLEDITELLDIELIPHQQEVMNLTLEYYKTNDNGILNLFCRYGKTRLSSLFALIAGYKKILILVPSLYLVKQTYKTWRKYFSSTSIIKISSTSTDISDKEKIKKKYQELDNLGCVIICISTYHSSYKLEDLDFNLGIYDEAHRTTGELSGFNKLVCSSKIAKKLFLTATLKYYDYLDTELETLKVNSMDNQNIYGQVIASVSAKQALKLKRICPYSIMTIKLQDILECGSNLQRKKIEKIIDKYIESNLEEDNVESISDGIKTFIRDNRKRYVRIAYGLIKVIQSTGIKHLITFHRYIACARLFSYILEEFFAKEQKFKVAVITGSDDKESRDNIIADFQTLEPDCIKCKILCNARVLQEGIDIPPCDAVAFVDLRSSAVDTIQALARCLTFQPDKEAYILIPFDKDDFKPIPPNNQSSESRDGNDMLDIKLSNYALNLRLILRNLVEIDDNIKEYFRNYILQLTNHPSGGADHIEPDTGALELVKCLVDETIIREMSEIVFDVFHIAKDKINKKYSTPEEYASKVALDFGYDLPVNPDIVYRKWGWRGWNDYLGIDPYMTVSQVRRHMQQINLERQQHGYEPMITSQLEYQSYAKDNNLMVYVKPPHGNWCWLLLPDYDELVAKYYKRKEDIQDTIRRLSIKSITDYESRYSRDVGLPPYQLLQNGFYNENILALGKNISTFISNCNTDDDLMI